MAVKKKKLCISGLKEDAPLSIRLCEMFGRWGLLFRAGPNCTCAGTDRPRSA